jgi:hypothetical protein
MLLLDQIAPLLILLVGALLILAGGRSARRIGLPERIGCGVALCILGVVIGLSPESWRAQWAAGDRGDRLLTYLRLVGLTGLLFLAGTNFRAKGNRNGEIVSFAIIGALLFTATTLVLRFVVNQPIGTAALIAATTVSSSLWFPTQLRLFEREGENIRSAPTAVIAVTLATVAMLALYFADVLTAIPGARRSVWGYLIVTVYELVKLAVLFGFAYFISTRFLTRAEGRISPIRTNVGFILISILFFALISVTVGQLGAIAWAFVAGALWRRTNAGEKLSLRAKPLASALLMSFVFLSLPLQSHGRQFSSFVSLLIIVLIALALKLALAWFVLKRDSVGTDQPMVVATAIAFPGELAILFLSFSITRWAIHGPVFFTLLAFAFLSSLLIVFLRQDLSVSSGQKERVYQRIEI